MKTVSKLATTLLIDAVGFTACDGSGGGSAALSNSPAATAVNLAETGQTTSYAANDDGALKKWASWPTTRFTVGVDCVRDNLTGLMWVKASGENLTWAASLTYINVLDYCGYSDWRLPNKKELRSLINFGQSNFASWLNRQGFVGIQSTSAEYWSSTTYAPDTTLA